MTCSMTKLAQITKATHIYLMCFVQQLQLQPFILEVATTCAFSDNSLAKPIKMLTSAMKKLLSSVLHFFSIAIVTCIHSYYVSLTDPSLLTRMRICQK
uniref:Uncharacterized protein n=1 Tax=Arundo donax TaxID=35708 RepID=A0A0A8YRN9_ARUDO